MERPWIVPRPLRVCVFSENRQDVFSGGRYYTLNLVEALAAGGHEVTYVTECVPVFWDDFTAAPGHDRIKLHVSDDFVSGLPEARDFDVVVVTPGRADRPRYYIAARRICLESDAQLALINFETPNWFNSLAPKKRVVKEWEHWKRALAGGGTVLSISETSDQWAKEFYTGEGLHFAHWCAPINTSVADAIPEQPKQNRAVIISRLTEAHKGMAAILEGLPDEMHGWTLVIITGSVGVSGPFKADLEAMCAARGLGLEIVMRPTDAEKFAELKRARLMLFPSLFEGYGYPPVEAMYADMDVVCYDLPVIRETCGDLPFYAAHGDVAAFKREVAKALKSERPGRGLNHAQVKDIASLSASAQRLESVLAPYAEPANRTTRPVKLPDLPQPGTSKLSQQAARVAALATPEGRKRASAKLRRMSSPVTRSALPARHAIEDATVDERGIIRLTGWHVSSPRADRIEVQIGDTIHTLAELNLGRPDVAADYPAYGDAAAGFGVLLRRPNETLAGAAWSLTASASGKVITEASGTLIPVTHAPPLWITRSLQDAAGHVAILCDGAMCGPNGDGLADLRRALAFAQKTGLAAHVIVSGNPPDLKPHEAHFAGLAENVVIADETIPEGGGISGALDQIHRAHTLSAIIALSPELEQSAGETPCFLLRARGPQK